MKRFAQWCVFFSAVLLCSQGAWATDSTMLPIERRMLFNAWTFFPEGSYYAANWTHDGPAPSSFPAGRRALLPGTNHVHTSVSGNVTNIWKLTACRTGTSAQLSTTAQFISPKAYVAPALPTNWQASLQNTLAAMIETPYYPEGIGTIYFESINVSPSDPTEITVEIATNMLEYVYLGGLPTNVMYESDGPHGGFVYSNNWQTISVLTLNAASSNDFTRYQMTLNYRQAARLRIRRTGTIATGYPNLDNAFTAIDNICISYPPSDVVIRKPEAVFQPGHPSVATNIAIRCYVDNLGGYGYERTDHAERTVMVGYRWRYLDQVVGAWQTNVMPYVSGTGDGQGNGERYQVDLPAQLQVGDLEYYFKCDFDGYRYQHQDYTQTGYAYVTEWLSPKTFRGGASQPDGREFHARLFPFASRFGAVSVVTDQHAEPIAMTLVGNEEWRGMVPLNNGITNLAWRFQGVSEYVSGADDFSTNLVCWTEQAQAGTGVMPCGGTCVATNAASRIRVLVDGGGYVQLIFNTDTLEYLASRAEYQNFNAWPAPPDKFTESSGQGSKQRFLNTFDAWPTNVSVVKEEFFRSAPPSINVYSREPFITLNGWLTGGSAYVLDRLAGDVYNRPYGVTSFRNVALRLKGADAAIGLGYVHNRVETRTDGVREISFKCRLGQSADRFTASYYKLGFANQNYLVRAQGGADAGMSPEAPTMSLLGYFKTPDNFYEFRMNQVTNPVNLTVTGDKRINFQLFKWSGGVPYLLKENRLNVDAVLTTPSLIEMRLYNSGSTTQIRCKFAIYDDILSYDDSGTIGGPAIQSGTVGFLSQECRSGFSAVRTNPTTSGAVEVGSDSSATYILDSAASQLSNWYTPAGHFEGRTDYATKGIYAVVPTQKLGVYLQASSDDSTTPPSMPGSVDWKLFKEVSLTGFGYSTHAVVFNQWRSDFVMLQVMGRSDSLKIDVAVDELRVSSWRGQESSDSGLAGDADWVATEAWVVTNSAALGNVVQFEHTRADTSKDQVIRSLLLTNGMGMLEFDYQVLRPPAKVTVQYAFDYDSSNWMPLRSLIVSNAMPGYVHELFYLGTNAPGYLRLLNERVDGYTNALVEINNATAWDEPDVGDSAWRGYNVKITDTDRARIMLDESKACFLNNSQTAETDPVQILHPEAYIKSPRLRWGMGSLSFMARAYTNTQSANVSLYATTSADGPGALQDQWFSVTNYTISSTLYATFKYQPSDGRPYTAVKLVTATVDGSARACLEEVAVSEPLFPKFDIVNVRLLLRTEDGEYLGRDQPLESDEIHVEAKIDNLLKVPSNIVMYVSYTVGTNVWGAGNWPSSGTVTRRLIPVDGEIMLFRTVPVGTLGVPAEQAGGISGQGRDQVVQYFVWADYMGGIPLSVRQDTFVNPEWYYQVDLNARYGDQGWSPYYIVFANDLSVAVPAFSSASGSVFTNSALVELTCATIGTAIHYTLDGTEPDADSPTYTGPIIVTQSVTINAKAYKFGMMDSATTKAYYIIIPRVAIPVLTPADGTMFTGLRKVSMSCTTEESEIRYTLDGSEPSRSSSLYTKAFNVWQTTTVKAKAFKAGMADSLTAAATYVRLLSLSDAADASGLTFTTGGDAVWFAQTNVTHDGVDALQSGSVGDGQVSWVETAVTGPGKLSFWWKTSCEDDPDADNWDFVRLLTKGVEQCREDGIKEWQLVTCAIGDGPHVVRWEYAKDESFGVGADCAWVDQISFVSTQGVSHATQTTPVPVPYLWLDQYPVMLSLSGGNYEIAAWSDMDEDGHAAWQEYVTGSNPTNRASVLRIGLVISNGVSLVAWTPDMGTSRVYTVDGKTNLADSVWATTNRNNRFFKVKVSMP